MKLKNVYQTALAHYNAYDSQNCKHWGSKNNGKVWQKMTFCIWNQCRRGGMRKKKVKKKKD